MNPVIRRATIADASFLIAANQTMALETEGKELLTDVISPGVYSLLEKPEYGFYLVATIEDAFAGCLMVTMEWSDWRNGLFWWIQSVFVSPEFRRQGVFRSLYRHVGELARNEKNVVGFRLYVERENNKAQRTYQAMGMQDTTYGNRPSGAMSAGDLLTFKNFPNDDSDDECVVARSKSQNPY